MAGLLHLTPGAPGIGLTKHNIYASLHGDSLRQTDRSRKPSPSINAPPRGSSSDEESDAQQVPDDGLSDDSEFGGSGKKRTLDIQAVLSTGTGSGSAKAEDGDKRELSVEPSNIRAGNFTSGTGPGSRNGSQGSQKRKNADVDEDDLPLSFSQSKRLRHGYGYGNDNIHRGSVTKSESHTRKPSTGSGKAGRPFRTVNTDAILARVDRFGAEPGKSEKPGWRETPAMQISQRDQRASQRSVKSTQESSQSSSKSFKQPPRPSPKKVPKFRAGPVIGQEVDPLLATRSSVPAKRSQVLIEDNTLRSSKLQNALTIATGKLGVSEIQTKLPPSPTRDISAPSTSLDTATTVSSPLSFLDSSILCPSLDGVPVITSEDIPVYNAENRPAVCPMCKQPVDRSYLEAFTKVGTRMSLRQQAQFCIAHKERSAESEWAKRGYPEIDWQQLDTRITNFHTFMDEILSRRRSSFYRNAFEDYLKSGKNKTLQESLMEGDEIEGTSPGYYGGRGAKVMYGSSFLHTHILPVIQSNRVERPCFISGVSNFLRADNIMSGFARKLRRLAASDKLISSGGVSRYVQAVLVPELAVLLIKDDMKVDEGRAREVLRDSVDIGNLLNEEDDEIITDPTPKEQGVVDMT